MKRLLTGLLLAAWLPLVAAANTGWQQIHEAEVRQLNADLKQELPTVDVGLYYPSNLDPDFRGGLALDELFAQFREAKRVFGQAGVQLKLLWVKSGAVAPSHLAIMANDVGSLTPDSEFANLYVNGRRNPSRMSPGALQAFEDIVEPDADNARTVYLVVLQRVFMSFHEKVDERTWTVRTIRTGGLSFPSYNYTGIPSRIRGVITISRADENDKVIAHELGHKLLNVSHEHRTVEPQHEVRMDEGLMLYGTGTEIASGAEGRWHRERLLLSPYVYRVDSQGNRRWNPDYREGGHYYDPIYGSNAVRFGPPLNP